MYKLLFFFCFNLIALFFPSAIYAHSAGQIPFFKINNVYSNLYPVPTTSLSDFQLPQDDSPDIYLVNEPIYFEIDIEKLPIPPEIVALTTFNWDFGDGEKMSGAYSYHHSYKKTGTYFVEITAQSAEVSNPQLIQSAIVHIVPSKDYKLPQSVIKVNGESVRDPLIDTIKTEFGKDFSFDGSQSVMGSGRIVEYFWDLGNGKSKNGAQFNYRYEKDQYAFFPVLRVRDENGLLSDSFLQVTNSLDEAGGSLTNRISDFDQKQISIIIVISIIGAGIASYFLWYILGKRSVHKSKH